MTAAAPRQRFRRDVEGLRAVAILLVVLYHVGVAGFSGGYVGVDVFFVISGFLITGQLTKELGVEGRVSLLGFYARRARRILPAAMLVIAVTTVVSAVVLDPITAGREVHDAMASVFFVANFHFAAEGANYFSASLPPSPLQHFWSLAVEEQFYLVWPLLLVASSLVWLRRRPGPGGPRRPAVGLMAAALAGLALASYLACLYETPRSASTAYYSIVTRGWELAVGGLVCLGVPLARRLGARAAAALSWAGLVAIAVAATTYTASTPYPGDRALLPVLGAAAVVVGGSRLEVAASASPSPGAVVLLGTLPFQRLGAWSYSWYLWHWPALVLAPSILGHGLTTPEALLVALAALVIAVASFYLVEQPMRRWPIAVRRPSVALGGAGAFAVTGLAVVLLSGALLPSLGPTRAQAVAAPPAVGSNGATRSNDPAAPSGGITPEQLAADLASGVKVTRIPSTLDPPLSKASGSEPIIVTNGCHLQHGPVRSKPCVYGDVHSKTSLVLFGDSHAAAWFPALDTVAKEHHWRLLDYTKAGCPPAEVNVALSNDHDEPYPQCTQWRTNTMASIAKLHPALVVVTWARFLEEPEASAERGVPTGYGSAYYDGVAAIFKFLHRAARHAVFLSDGPTLDQLAPECVAGHPDDVRACVTPPKEAYRLPAVKARELALARRLGVDGVDPDPWFCAPTGCPVIVGNILMYRDNAHMTPAWSDFIAPVLADILVPLVDGSQA